MEVIWQKADMRGNARQVQPSADCTHAEALQNAHSNDSGLAVDGE